MSNEKKLRQDVARRIAGRLMRANNGKAIALAARERAACVEAITSRFVTPALRAQLFDMWHGYKPALDAAEWEDPRPVPELDARIDKL